MSEKIPIKLKRNIVYPSLEKFVQQEMIPEELKLYCDLEKFLPIKAEKLFLAMKECKQHGDYINGKVQLVHNKYGWPFNQIVEDMKEHAQKILESMNVKGRVTLLSNTNDCACDCHSQYNCEPVVSDFHIKSFLKAFEDDYNLNFPNRHLGK